MYIFPPTRAFAVSTLPKTKNKNYSTYVRRAKRAQHARTMVYVRTDGVSPIGQSWAAAAAGGGRCNVCTPECTLRVRVTGMDMLYCIYSIQYTVHAACTGYRVTGLPGLWDTVRCDVIGPGHPSQPRLTGRLLLSSFWGKQCMYSEH